MQLKKYPIWSFRVVKIQQDQSHTTKQRKGYICVTEEIENSSYIMISKYLTI